MIIKHVANSAGLDENFSTPFVDIKKPFKLTCFCLDRPEMIINYGSNGIGNYLNPKGHGANNDIDNSLILKLLENSEMKDKFLTRFGEVFRFFTTERMLAQIDECYRILELFRPTQDQGRLYPLVESARDPSAQHCAQTPRLLLASGSRVVRHD